MLSTMFDDLVGTELPLGDSEKPAVVSLLLLYTFRDVGSTTCSWN